MQDNISFGVWLRQQRKALGLTQEDLAQRVGCARATIRKLEADERRPSMQVAERLARFLEIPEEAQAAFLRAARVASPIGRTSTKPVPELSGQLPPTNLPQPTGLIGREHDCRVIRNRVLRNDVRVLTLVGPGGVGKTSLAARVGFDVLRAFPDGVFFIALASITNPDHVILTIAQTLGFKEAGTPTTPSSLAAFIGERQMLLILDNFEQVVAAGPTLMPLLAACEALKVMVTSRIPLRIRGERCFEVPPLALPDLDDCTPTIDVVSRSAAVALFVERANGASPGFTLTNANVQDVAAICARMDGLPLAIELVAARCKLLSPADLLNRLEGVLGHTPLQLLKGDLLRFPERHQTLRNTLQWSFELLSEPEQILFGRIAVFVAGCHVEAIEDVCNFGDYDPADVLDGLQTLMDNHLLRKQASGEREARLSMLWLIRAFAWDRLSARGETAQLQQRHALYYLALAERAEAYLTGPTQQQWLDVLERDHDNLRAALDWALLHDAETAARLAAALWRFWWMRGHFSEGRRWLEAILAQDGAANAVRGRVLNGAGVLADEQGDYTQAITRYHQSLELRRTIGDTRGIAESLNNIGTVLEIQGKYDQAQEYFLESLRVYREYGDLRGISVCLTNLGVIAANQGKLDQARMYYVEGLSIDRQRGDVQNVAVSLGNLGHLAFDLAQYEEAYAYYLESLRLYRQQVNRHGIARSQLNLGVAAEKRGDIAAAKAHLIDSLHLHRELSDQRGMSECLEAIARLAVVERQPTRAARLLGAAHTLRESIGAPVLPSEQALYSQTIADARAQLADAWWSAAWTAGRALSVEEAIAYALEEEGVSVNADYSYS